MIRIISLVLLLAPQVSSEVELPLERESLTRRQRRQQKESIHIPLEGILLAPIMKEKVEVPLPREDVARRPTYLEKGEGDFDRLLDRLRALFRRELTETKDITTNIPSPPRLRPVREPSKIRRIKNKRAGSIPLKKEMSKVQIMGLPEDHPAWLGPIPQGNQEWRKEHPVTDGQAALRIKAWSRKDGRFHPFQVRIKAAFDRRGGLDGSILQNGQSDGLVVQLPRHHIYQVEVWAGEPLLPRVGYVSLTESHHDLIGEMLPWNASEDWKAVAMEVGEAFPLLPDRGLSDWKQCLRNMDLHFMGLKSPIHTSSQGKDSPQSLKLEDLIGWCMTASRDRPILPWQTLAGKSGVELKALGSFETLTIPDPSPKAFLTFLKKAKKAGAATFLQGLQKHERYGDLTWSPLALMLLSGELPSGIVLRDDGDWELYMKLLTKGIRLSCLESSQVQWSGQPFGGDHLLKFKEGPRQVVKSLKLGKIIVGSGVRLNFRIYDRPGGNAMAEIGDRWVPPSGNQTYQLLPKLQFELDSQSDGLRKVELWVNGKRSQPTPLSRPLKRGEALFSFEGLKQGDSILTALYLSGGKKIFSNPIFIGEDTSQNGDIPLRIHLPQGWEKGFLLLRNESGLKEVELKPGPALEVSSSLLGRLEIWSDKGEVFKTTPLETLLSDWKEKNPRSIRENPIAQWEAMKALLPLDIDWTLPEEKTP